MRLSDLIESEYNRRPLHWVEKQTRSAILSASSKLKQMVDATGWLRLGVEDTEDGENKYSDYLKKYDGGYERDRGSFCITLSGKHIPIDHEMHLADLIDAEDSETNKRIRDKIERLQGKRLTADDIEAMNNKSLRMMQSLIAALAKTRFHVWMGDKGIKQTLYLDHIEWYTGSHYARVEPGTAAENLARVYPKNLQHIEDFGRELYAPHVELFFKIKTL
jgi:hypothetical protein